VVLSAAVLALVSFGLVMVYSSSSSTALLNDGNPLGFAVRQALFAVVGFGAYLVCTRLDMRMLQRIAGMSVVASGLLLVAALIPSVGMEVNGSRRWLPFPLIGQIQPSEFAKLALILWIASAIARDPRRVTTLEGVLPYLIVTTLFAGLILAEPDLGTASMLFLVSLAMLLVAGARPAHMLGVLAAAGAAAAVAIAMAPYRRDRMLAFLDPWSDPAGNGFQVIQAQIALGSGGVTGVGLGDGLQKAFYLPEAHTDMILATIGEELGLMGVVAVLAGIAVVVLAAFRIAIAARDLHQRLLAVGLATLVAAQALDNTGAVLGVMPITGVPLPFISYGGSSLIVLLAAVGILVNIGRRATTTTQRGSRRPGDANTGAGGDRRERDGRARRAGAGGGRGAARAWG
jgi:cell division protein FtsW